MKKLSFIVLALIILVGCGGGNQGNTDSATNTGDAAYVNADSANRTGTANDAWDKDKITEFVLKMASAGLMEVQLGQMAQKMAVNSQVRDFGKMMEKDHSDANTKLKSAVQNLQINIPTTLQKDHQDMIDDLRNKKGKDFDQAYIDEMVDDHKEDIDDLEKASDKVTDTELKNWINNTLPVLRAHHENAQRIKDQLKNM